MVSSLNDTFDEEFRELMKVQLLFPLAILSVTSTWLMCCNQDALESGSNLKKEGGPTTLTVTPL
jgi:hypothetical protein